jgi:hypothetical protein
MEDLDPGGPKTYGDPEQNKVRPRLLIGYLLNFYLMQRRVAPVVFGIGIRPRSQQQGHDL